MDKRSLQLLPANITPPVMLVEARKRRKTEGATMIATLITEDLTHEGHPPSSQEKGMHSETPMTPAFHMKLSQGSNFVTPIRTTLLAPKTPLQPQY